MSLSQYNSTTTPILANGLFAGSFENVLQYSTAVITITADTETQLTVYQSQLGNSVLDTVEYPSVPANTSITYNVPLNLQYFRLQLDNLDGEADQTVCNLSTIYRNTAAVNVSGATLSGTVTVSNQPPFIFDHDGYLYTTGASSSSDISSLLVLTDISNALGGTLDVHVTAPVNAVLYSGANPLGYVPSNWGNALATVAQIYDAYSNPIYSTNHALNVYDGSSISVLTDISNAIGNPSAYDTSSLLLLNAINVTLEGTLNVSDAGSIVALDNIQSTLSSIHVTDSSSLLVLFDISTALYGTLNVSDSSALLILTDISNAIGAPSMYDPSFLLVLTDISLALGGTLTVADPDSTSVLLAIENVLTNNTLTVNDPNGLMVLTDISNALGSTIYSYDSSVYGVLVDISNIPFQFGNNGGLNVNSNGNLYAIDTVTTAVTPLNSVNISSVESLAVSVQNSSAINTTDTNLAGCISANQVSVNIEGQSTTVNTADTNLSGCISGDQVSVNIANQTFSSPLKVQLPYATGNSNVSFPSAALSSGLVINQGVSGFNQITIFGGVTNWGVVVSESNLSIYYSNDGANWYLSSAPVTGLPYSATPTTYNPSVYNSFTVDLNTSAPYIGFSCDQAISVQINYCQTQN